MKERWSADTGRLRRTCRQDHSARRPARRGMMKPREATLTKLYTQLAETYHEMYQSIFDYDEEFRTAHRVLRAYSVRRLLEIGCGAGNLAGRFAAAGYAYTGMDSAKPMLRIARRENPEAHFLHQDMRRFTARQKFDAVVVGGRSFTYMTSNADVLAALRCIRRALRPKGVLVFDNFNASVVLKDLSRPLREEVRVGRKSISRASKRTLNLRAGWTWNWDASYVIKEGLRQQTFRDHSVLRAFTRDELQLFLILAGFTPVRFRLRGSIILAVAQA
jgi:SAM-dependent methyltransferase